MRAASLDHLGGCHQQFVGYFEAEHLGGGEGDDEIKFGRLLDGEGGRLRLAQNLVDIVGGAPEQVREIWTIGHQTSRLDVLPGNCKWSAGAPPWLRCECGRGWLLRAGR